MLCPVSPTLRGRAQLPPHHLKTKPTTPEGETENSANNHPHNKVGASRPAMTHHLLDTVLSLHDAGFTLIPLANGTSKRPAISWGQYRTTRPGRALVADWFAPPSRQGVAVLTGAASGNLEMTEIEGAAAHHLRALWEHLENTAPGLATLLSGCVERSPSGGIHWFYRLDTVPGNQKIAATANGVTLAETRGEGGYTVIAPTPGAYHLSGKPWERISGSLLNTPILTVHQRNIFHCTLYHLLDSKPGTVCPACGLHADRTHPTPPPKPTSAAPQAQSTSEMPLTDFCHQVDMMQQLQAAGWTRCPTADTAGQVAMTRPGKPASAGASAYIHGEGAEQVLAVFTTSTDFETVDTPRVNGRTGYNTAQIEAVLRYGNDEPETMRQLARDLRREGFGARVPAASIKSVIVWKAAA